MVIDASYSDGQRAVILQPRGGPVGINFLPSTGPVGSVALDINGGTWVRAHLWAGGPVGIGTTTPTAGKALDVIGDARVAGRIDTTGPITAGTNADPQSLWVGNTKIADSRGALYA